MLKLDAGVAKAQRVLFGLLGWRSVATLVLFGCGGIVYALLLRRVPLTIVQSSTAAQFVGVIIAASLGNLCKSRLQ
jgi:ABC-type branched-subunit amino acid transport system permease subunit